MRIIVLGNKKPPPNPWMIIAVFLMALFFVALIMGNSDEDDRSKAPRPPTIQKVQPAWLGAPRGPEINLEGIDLEDRSAWLAI